MGTDVRHSHGPETTELTAAETGRLDAVLSRALPELSRARVQRLIEAGNVRVNGEVVRKSATVQDGDLLEFEVPATDHAIAPSGLNLPLLYDDADLSVIDKPPGLAVHGAPGDTGPSVAGWWLERLGPAAAGFDAERPGIVHRLDKDTSGVLLLAKTPAAQAALSRAFEERTTRKTYLAIVEGKPRPAPRRGRRTNRPPPGRPHAHGRNHQRAPLPHRIRAASRRTTNARCWKSTPRPAAPTKSGSTLLPSAARSPTMASMAGARPTAASSSTPTASRCPTPPAAHSPSPPRSPPTWPARFAQSAPNR